MSLELCHTTNRLFPDTAMLGESDSSISSLTIFTGSKLAPASVLLARNTLSSPSESSTHTTYTSFPDTPILRLPCVKSPSLLLRFFTDSKLAPAFVLLEKKASSPPPYYVYITTNSSYLWFK